MLNLKRKLVTASLILTAGIGTMAPMAAHASEAGRRNTTLALGALTAVLAAKGQWLPAAVAGAGTVVAQQKWQGDINKRHNQEDWQYNRGNDRQDYQNNNNWSQQGWNQNNSNWSQQGWNQNNQNRYDQNRYDQNRYDQNRHDQNRYDQNRYDQNRHDQDRNDQDRNDRDRNDRDHDRH